MAGIAGLDLGKQLGPLPLGAWIAVVGGGLGIAYYSRQSGSSEDDSPLVVNDTTGGYAGVGVGGTPAYTSVGTSTPVVAEEPITENETWGRRAINALITQHNYDSELTLSAITKYLDSQELSASEMTLIARAIAILGAPPVPLIPRLKVTVPTVVTPIVATPTPTPVNTPVVTPAPAPVAAPAQRTYTVVRGDNLSRIAQRYYGRQDWQKIYNANRGIIKNPNLIYPGQVLVIPY